MLDRLSADCDADGDELLTDDAPDLPSTTDGGFSDSSADSLTADKPILRHQRPRNRWLQILIRPAAPSGAFLTTAGELIELITELVRDTVEAGSVGYGDGDGEVGRDGYGERPATVSSLSGTWLSHSLIADMSEWRLPVCDKVGTAGLGESARIFLAYGESSWWLTYEYSGRGLLRYEAEWTLDETWSRQNGRTDSAQRWAPVKQGGYPSPAPTKQRSGRRGGTRNRRLNWPIGSRQESAAREGRLPGSSPQPEIEEAED